MKKIIITTFVILAALFTSCGGGGGEDNGGGTEGDAVTAADIAGQWRLSSWNGTAVDTALFDVYVRFSGENTVVIYQHTTDYGYVQQAGTFTITDNNRLSGSYDDGSSWTDSYTVKVASDKSQLQLTTVDGADVYIYNKTTLPGDFEVGLSALSLTRAEAEERALFKL